MLKNLKNFLNVVLVSFIILILVGATCPPTPPNWDGELWAGNNNCDGKPCIQRFDDNNNLQQIYTDDEKFKNFLALTPEDWVKIINIIDSCEEWSKQLNEILNSQSIQQIEMPESN